MIYFFNFFNILQENNPKKYSQEKNIFGNLKEMNLTSIEKKDIINFDKKNKAQNKQNINIKKIEPKKIGIKNMIGSINPVMKNSRIQSNTISLANKLSEISDKLEEFQNKIDKFDKEFK